MSAPADATTVRKQTVVRAFVVHMTAYAVALPWGVAAVPAVFVWKEHDLLALGDERDAVVLVLQLALVPACAAFLASHALGIPWVLAARRSSVRGRRLVLAGDAALALAGAGLAIVAWLRLFQR